MISIWELPNLKFDLYKMCENQDFEMCENQDFEN
jgi:hypothetical protein